MLQFGKDVNYLLTFFIICIVLLAVAIPNDPNLRIFQFSIFLKQKKNQISLYEAEDITLLLSGKEEARQ